MHLVNDAEEDRAAAENAEEDRAVVEDRAAHENVTRHVITSVSRVKLSPPQSKGIQPSWRRRGYLCRDMKMEIIRI